MSNETKRDVFEDLVEELADAYIALDGEGIGEELTNEDKQAYLKDYDNALPDDLPVIPELIGKYLKMRKQDHGNLVQALDEGTSFVLDGTQWESVQDWFWFSDVKDSVDTFARAWVLGVWRVEETGEVVKL
ncbi:hypothetical protein EFP22_14480 [Lacticaseibacillus paracasei]|uniref:hypothetical protein n=1 Tax=Lacticaseibacillus paracasei TaxID=1597 RepID=UPI000343C214|nr:hypothetical protein [Lacticaseibacillus paracasei]EPC43088.1 hypothetical protein Lpp229_09803 [Lacticaseibacillus paracasei subsp. paracasei Lpp229]MCT3320478.1 hypothetical protein [Lacticaseibacillus paracasei]